MKMCFLSLALFSFGLGLICVGVGKLGRCPDQRFVVFYLTTTLGIALNSTRMALAFLCSQSPIIMVIYRLVSNLSCHSFLKKWQLGWICNCKHSETGVGTSYQQLSAKQALSKINRYNAIMSCYAKFLHKIIIPFHPLSTTNQNQKFVVNRLIIRRQKMFNVSVNQTFLNWLLIHSYQGGNLDLYDQSPVAELIDPNTFPYKSNEITQWAFTSNPTNISNNVGKNRTRDNEHSIIERW